MSSEKTFHLITIFHNYDSVSKEVLSRIFDLSSKGFRRFVIHVISPIPKPLYMEKLRDLISNNIANTLIIKYAGSSPKDLDLIVKEVKEKPHLVLVFPDMIEYYGRALSLNLNVEKIT